MVFLLTQATAYAQVNTEILRKTNLQKGFYNTLSFQYGYITGNSEILRIGANYRADLLYRRHYAFLIADYQRATNRNRLSLHKGFTHLRYVYRFYKGIKGELFTQKEFNEFLLLKDRQLFGGGARFELQLLDTAQHPDDQITLNAGTGFMHEREMFNKPEIPDTRIIRSTNYLSGKIILSDKFSFTLIGYYQKNIRHRKDFRILVNSTAGINLSKKLMATTTFNFRYDHDPPLRLKKYDLEIVNGLVIHF